MEVGEAPYRYEWIDHWAKLPDNASSQNNGRTHGVEVLPDGRIVVFCQADPAVLIFNTEGELLNSFGHSYIGAHGLSLIEEDGQTRMWVTDQEQSTVEKLSLEGEVLQRLAEPPVKELDGKPYVPTWAVQNPNNGEIWVADGYGSGFVFHFSDEGDFLAKLDGTEGEERFSCPHGLAFSPDNNELWVTDRGNRRVCVYDEDGRFLQARQYLCHSPCSFAFHEGNVYIPELFTGIKIITPELEYVAEVGKNPAVGPADGAKGEVSKPEGWPNLAGTDQVKPGLFNSPHDVAVAPNGDIYVTEWIIGGRVTKLKKLG